MTPPPVSERFEPGEHAVVITLSRSGEIHLYGTAVSPRQMAGALYRLAHQFDTQARQHADHKSLSPDQTRVVTRLAQGQHRHQIAAALDCSTRTVRRHCRAAETNLGAATLPHLIALALLGDTSPPTTSGPAQNEQATEPGRNSRAG